MPIPPFELFEHICKELAGRDGMVRTPEDFPHSIMAGLEDFYREPVKSEAVSQTISDLRDHFAKRGSTLPFTYKEETGEFFNDKDPDYVDFISRIQLIRGIGKKARDFEISITIRLSFKVTGIVHRVGWPRTHKSRKREFIHHLADLGFRRDVIYGRDKDGGLDVLWLPPLGAIPIRPIVSLQCKNSDFSRAEADKSTGRAQQTLRRHSVRSAESTHMCCIVFNDYIDDSHEITNRDCSFVPLGLSDLGWVSPQVVPVIL